MHTHTKVPTEATIIVSNILPTQVAFGVRMDNGEQCYVPSTVSMAAAMEIGLEYKVKLVQNQDEERAKRTPWIAIWVNPFQHSEYETIDQALHQLKNAELTPPKQEVSVASRVRHTMLLGGVWNNASMFEALFPNMKRTDNGNKEYNAVGAALRYMHDHDECAKYTMYRKGSQTKPSAEWFACFPENVEIEEYEDET